MSSNFLLGGGSCALLTQLLVYIISNNYDCRMHLRYGYL